MDMQNTTTALSYEPVRSDSHGCTGCPYATKAERKRIVRAFGDRFVVDLNDKRRVTWNGEKYHFTPAQTQMLAAFAIRAGRVITVDHLLLALYGKEVPDSGATTLKIHVSKVCQSFKDNDVPLRIFGLPDEGGYVLQEYTN